MADGFRVLENGDLRITEADVFRITEQFSDAFADLNAAGTLSADPTYINPTLYGFVDLNAAGTLASIGSTAKQGSVTLTGAGTLNSVGVQTFRPTADLSAVGSKVFAGYYKYQGLADLGGEGYIVSSANYRYKPLANLSADTTLAADGTKISFASTLYVKDTSWKVTTPYVKHNGSWKTPDLIYVKVSGAWQRVY
jgi:hypothetical protein